MSQDQTVSQLPAWAGDHTALVHVLWGARNAGLTLHDADELARFIRRSHYRWATQELAAGGRAPVLFRGAPDEHTRLDEAEQASIDRRRAAQAREQDEAAEEIAGRHAAPDVARSAIAEFRAWLSKPRRQPS